jgi:hypothetical protein
VAASINSRYELIKTIATSAVLFMPLAAWFWNGRLYYAPYQFWPFLTAVWLALIAYCIYRALNPSAPKRHWLFMSVALVLGLTGTHIMFSEEHAGQWQFILLAVESLAAYGLYRLVMRASEHFRKTILLAIVVILSLVLPLHIHEIHNAFTRPQCCPRDDLEQWRANLPRDSVLLRLFNTPHIPGCVDCGQATATGKKE